jgi:hypothetical protein
MREMAVIKRTYVPLRLYPRYLRVAEASQIFLRDAHVLRKCLAMKNTAVVTGGKPIAV